MGEQSGFEQLEWLKIQGKTAQLQIDWLQTYYNQ